MTSEYQNSIEELEKEIVETKNKLIYGRKKLKEIVKYQKGFSRSAFSSVNKTNAHIREREVLIKGKLEGLKLGRKLTLEEELAFLQSKDMKDLIHEADIGVCHDECIFINNRIEKLKEELK